MPPSRAPLVLSAVAVAGGVGLVLYAVTRPASGGPPPPPPPPECKCLPSGSAQLVPCPDGYKPDPVTSECVPITPPPPPACPPIESFDKTFADIFSATIDFCKKPADAIAGQVVCAIEQINQFGLCNNPAFVHVFVSDSTVPGSKTFIGAIDFGSYEYDPQPRTRQFSFAPGIVGDTLHFEIVDGCFFTGIPGLIQIIRPHIRRVSGSVTGVA